MTTETLQCDIPDPTFEELLLFARQGSKDALGRVLESCRRVLLRAARRQIPSDVQSKGTASDVVQDTFLEAQRDFPQFTGSTRIEFVAWLSRILENNSTNLVHAYRNRRKRDVAREVSLDDPGIAPQLARVQAPEHPPGAAIAHEEAEILLAAIDHLPEQSQAVLRLRFQERLSFEEMANRLGCSPEAARKAVGRILKRLSARSRCGATKPS